MFSRYSNTNPLIVLDLANNHNGSVDHGKRIIDEVAEIVSRFPYEACIKFQFRNLPSFIHSDFQERTDIGYVNRFLSTKLSWEDFSELQSYARENGLLTACTPFDEFSVNQIIEQKFDFLKIASASFTDWPLIEAIDSWRGPIIASTAGANISDLDRVVTFLTNRKKEFALMHCVAAYPTDDKDLQLNRISKLHSRYNGVSIGYSTHESPDNTTAAPLALASGAIILERHVGSSFNGNSVNLYSSEKTQLHNWFTSIKSGIEMLGSDDSFSIENESEKKALRGLRRFAYAKKNLNIGSKFDVSDVFFAIPGEDAQFTASDFGKYSVFEAERDIAAGEAISRNNTIVENNESEIFKIREAVLSFISLTGVVIPNNAELEISHHYGIASFRESGSCMITVVNRDYCKKYIILLPGQNHPDMYHKIKDETFFVLYGEITLRLNEEAKSMQSGETIAIPPLAVHGFATKSGAVIEEVSTMHISNDSFYIDENINGNPNRKTIVRYWL